MQIEEIEKRLIAIRQAAQFLRRAPTQKKDGVLKKTAELLLQRKPEILAANQKDLADLDSRASTAFKDRLTLNDKRVAEMVESLIQVAAQADPVDETVEQKTLANGLKARKVRAPLGVILMIFESRPNVAVEAFSLAFKSGNLPILRGGKESMKTTAVLYEILTEALVSEGFEKDTIWGIIDPDRRITENLLQQSKYIDVVVPRGGEGLIDFVVRNTRIPVIKNDRGLCHIYIHEDADQEMALKIILNAKTQRPSACNAMETLLVHEKNAAQLLPLAYERLSSFDVEWFGCARTMAILKGKGRLQSASSTSWDTEYLDFKLNCRIVNSLEEAIAHIDEHGSKHSEAVITKSAQCAHEFEARVDAAAVYWNASTRFTDGFALGLGGELGISTQKLHVRGPLGLRELTTPRWIIEGDGQVRL